MSDTIKSLTVTFQADVGEEHANRVVDAIRLCSGVVNVAKNVQDPDHWVAKMQVQNEVRKKLLDIILEIK